MKIDEVPIDHVELREEAYGMGYVMSAMSNPETEGVELWVDHPIGDSRPALANIRLTCGEALRLAAQIGSAVAELSNEKEKSMKIVPIPQPEPPLDPMILSVIEMPIGALAVVVGMDEDFPVIRDAIIHSGGDLWHGATGGAMRRLGVISHLKRIRASWPSSTEIHIMEAQAD